MVWVLVLLLPLLASAQENTQRNAVGVESVEAVSNSHVLLVASGSAGNSGAVKPENKAAGQGKKDTEADADTDKLAGSQAETDKAGSRAETNKPAEKTGKKELDPRREMDPSGGY